MYEIKRFHVYEKFIALLSFFPRPDNKRLVVYSLHQREEGTARHYLPELKEKYQQEHDRQIEEALKQIA